MMASVNQVRRRLRVVLPDTYWRSLLYLNWYRLGVVAIVTIAAVAFGRRMGMALSGAPYLGAATLIYCGIAATGFATIRWRRPLFELQLTAFVAMDVAYLVLFMAVHGGVSGGFGILLIPYLAAVSLISRGRMSLFQAALAVLAVLAEETWVYWSTGGQGANFVQAGFLCLGYFATAWLARSLARYAVENEKLAEQRGIDLANLAALNELVIQSMPSGVLVADGYGRVRQSNQQVERFLGPPRVRKLPILADFHAELPAALKAWHEAPESDTALLRSAQGKSVRARFVPVELNREGGVLIFFDDAEREHREAQQLKLAALGRLTANIAHEVRNPLSAISHAGELLAEDMPSGTSRRLLQIIKDNSARIEKIVNDVLAVNSRDRAQLERHLLPAFLQHFLLEWTSSEGLPVEAFVLDGAEAVEVLFDRGHLHQVVWNVCANAWRHSRRGSGSVRLLVSYNNYEVRLDVIDDGAGVPDDLRMRLFEPFFTTGGQQGNGLGLFIAKEICQANGAELSFVGNRPGADFRITFKRMVEEELAATLR